MLTLPSNPASEPGASDSTAAKRLQAAPSVTNMDGVGCLPSAKALHWCPAPNGPSFGNGFSAFSYPEALLQHASGAAQQPPTLSGTGSDDSQPPPAAAPGAGTSESSLGSMPADAATAAAADSPVFEALSADAAGEGVADNPFMQPISAEAEGDIQFKLHKCSCCVCVCVCCHSPDEAIPVAT